MMMRKFSMVSVATLTFAMMASAHAGTITTDFSTWAAAVGPDYATTTQFGVPNYSNVSSLALADGQTIGFSDDQVYTSGGTWTQLGIYQGQLIDTTGSSETITFSPSIYGLGFIINPDGGGVDTVTISLSDGTTTSLSNVDFANGATQFVGFYGGGQDALTVSFNNAADFVFGDIHDLPVPEPMSMALMMTGMAGLGWARRRSGRKDCLPVS